MKKTMKKILCTLLVVVMCMTAAPLQGFVLKVEAVVYEGYQKEGAIKWVLDSNTGEMIITGNGEMEYYIENAYNPYLYHYSPVFGYSIAYSNIIKSAKIGNGITTVGANAFCNCYYLSNVELPDTIREIHMYAFEDCSFSEIDIPKDVTFIGIAAFANNENLSSIILPEELIKIESSAFSSCNKMKTVYMSNKVTNIANYAFSGCSSLTDVYYKGSEEQWKNITIGSYNEALTNATIHYNSKPAPTSYFMVSSDQYSVDSINGKENATYKIHLLDQNSSFLPIDNVTVQNNTEYIIAISTKKVSDTELELTVEPIKDGDASISLFNGDGSLEQFFNFTVYSNTTTYRADQVPVTNEKLKTNFSRGDLTVDNFEYYFDENKGKYIASMDVYNSSGAIGVVAAYTQDGKISAIKQVDPYVPLPGDFGEFLVYLGTGAVSYLKGESFNYRYAGDSQKTPIEIEVPEDGYLTVSCDVLSDNAVFVSNAVSIAVDTIFKSTAIITALVKIGDTEGVAKKTKKSLLNRVVDIFNDDDGWAEKVVEKFTKKIPKELSLDFVKEISNLSFDAISELFKDADKDIYKVVLDIIFEITKEELVEYGAVKMATKAVKDKVIEATEESLLKAASLMFKGGEYINLINSMLGAYRYNDGTGKTMVVFKPKGEDGFICKDTIKVKSDIITDEVLLHTYVIKDTQKEDAFVRKTIYSDFNRGDGLRKEELSIDLNRIVEIHEISLLKNGQEVFDTFTATVKMSLPAYINKKTCSVYRVEKDGTYTKLDTRIEEGEIVFETDHFSEYILTGVIEDLQETTPCDVHVYEEVRTDPSCTEEGSITYTCYCGDTYTETITAPGHTEEIIPAVAATCTATGLTEGKKCSVCGEILVAQTETPVVDHSDSDSDGLCDHCSEQLAPLFVIGDVDNNGKIESTDARLALRAAVKLETLTETQTQAADADKNGKLEAADARLILRAAVGLETL